MILDYVRQNTSEKYGEYGLFEHLLFFYFFNVWSDLTHGEDMKHISVGKLCFNFVYCGFICHSNLVLSVAVSDGGGGGAVTQRIGELVWVTFALAFFFLQRYSWHMNDYIFQTADLANANASEIDKVIAAVAQSNKGFEPAK